MPKDLYSVTGRVLWLQFRPKYPVWLSVILDVVKDDDRGEYGISQAVEKITCDGKDVDFAGLVAWANEMPPEGTLVNVYVEMKVCDHDYVGVHEAHFTAKVEE